MISLKIILGQWKYIKAFNSSEKKKHFKCLISRLANEVLIFIRVRMHSHIKLNGKKIHVAHISYCFISILTLKVQSIFKRCVHSFTYAWLKEYVALCHFTAFFLVLCYFFNSNPHHHIVSDLCFTAHVH